MLGLSLLEVCAFLNSRLAGAGAFAFENVRTSVEHGARHVTRWHQEIFFILCLLEAVVGLYTQGDTAWEARWDHLPQVDCYLALWRSMQFSIP